MTASANFASGRYASVLLICSAYVAADLTPAFVHLAATTMPGATGAGNTHVCALDCDCTPVLTPALLAAASACCVALDCAQDAAEATPCVGYFAQLY